MKDNVYKVRATGVLIENNSLLLVNQKSGLRGYSRTKKPIYFGESDPINYYFSKSQLIYSDKLAKFVVRANELTDGLVIKRVGKIYRNIFIDEVINVDRLPDISLLEYDPIQVIIIELDNIRCFEFIRYTHILQY